MQNPGGWLQGIQYFRAIAIMEIVLLHIAAFGTLVPNPPWMAVVLRVFTSFGVPHFIFISGVVLYNRYSNGFSLSTFYKKRLSAVVPPYLVWSTFYFAFFFVVSMVNPSSIPQLNLLSVVPLYGANQSVATLVSMLLYSWLRGAGICGLSGS